MFFNYRNPHHGRTLPLRFALDEKISVRRPLPSLRRTALGEKTWSSVRLGPPSAFVRGRPSSSYDVWSRHLEFSQSVMTLKLTLTSFDPNFYFGWSGLVFQSTQLSRSTENYLSGRQWMINLFPVPQLHYTDDEIHGNESDVPQFKIRFNALTYFIKKLKQVL